MKILTTNLSQNDKIWNEHTNPPHVSVSISMQYFTEWQHAKQSFHHHQHANILVARWIHQPLDNWQIPP